MRGGEKGKGKRDFSALFSRGAGSFLAFSLFLLPFSLTSLTACGNSKKKETSSKGSNTKKDDDNLPSADFGSGETTVFTSTAQNSPISFTVVWQRGGLTVSDGNVETGHLNDVRGDIYSTGKISSNYRADRGDAVHATKRLTLTGNVVLNSKDGTASLKAPQAEYRGDLKFVRAMGGVIAEGPFGTLSGVPELWATPDLSLIGTPDMVSQKLHIPALIALAATTATATPVLQKGTDLKVEGAPSQRVTAIKGTNNYQILLMPKAGVPVKVTLQSRNMVFTSVGTVEVVMDGKANEVRSLKSKGAAEVVQTKPGKKLTLTGNGVDYTAKAGETTGTVELGGRVTIISVSEDKDSTGKPSKRTVIAKGDQATALLYSKPDTGVDPLKSATLVKNVTLDVTGTSGHFTGEGDKIVYTPNSTGARAVMTGNLRFGGDSPAYLGTIEGADTATINLSKEGWEDVLLEDSGGKAIDSTINDKKPPKSEATPPKKKKKGDPR